MFLSTSNSVHSLRKQHKVWLYLCSRQIGFTLRKLLIDSFSYRILKSKNRHILYRLYYYYNDVKSFPRQSRSRGGGSNITFKTNIDFTHTSFEVVQASITLQHNTLHFFCLYRPPPNRRNNLAESMFTEQLPDLLDYVNNLPGFVVLLVV